MLRHRLFLFGERRVKNEMIDFLMISTRSTKRGVIEIYPKFIIKKSSDLMIRGGDFYAIWIEERGLWSTDRNHWLKMRGVHWMWQGRSQTKSHTSCDNNTKPSKSK